MAQHAATFAAEILRRLLASQPSVRLLAATGASQLEFLAHLVALPGIEWPRVELFHLDEYLGLDESHPASFVRYIRQRIIEPTGIHKFHLLSGTADPAATIANITQQIRKAPIDLAFAGIGENGHLAFNDPPADFETSDAYRIVQLDSRCRMQQVGEGWFNTLEEVPVQAYSITVPQLLESSKIVCVVPDARKAEAVRNSLQGPITSNVPASALQRHPDTTVFLDSDSASLLPSHN